MDGTIVQKEVKISIILINITDAGIKLGHEGRKPSGGNGDHRP
jgi:hypothetical protein